MGWDRVYKLLRVSVLLDNHLKFDWTTPGVTRHNSNLLKDREKVKSRSRNRVRGLLGTFDNMSRLRKVLKTQKTNKQKN